jgi:hypothetical protein
MTSVRIHPAAEVVMRYKTFAERLSKMTVLEWTPELALTAAESLRKDRAYGINSMKKLDEMILARRKEMEKVRPKRRNFLDFLFPKLR